MKRYMLPVMLICLMFFSTGSCYGLGDGSSCSTDTPYASGFVNTQEEKSGRSVIGTFGYESVLKRRIEDKSGATCGREEGSWYLIGIGYRLNSQIEPYMRIGYADMDISWAQNNSAVKIDGVSGLAIGAGLKATVYKTRLTSLSQLKFNIDGQVRWLVNGDPDSYSVNGASKSVSAEDMQIFEGRIAATAGFEISLKKMFEDLDSDEAVPDAYLVPYVGAAYSDSIITAKFDADSTTYGYSNANDRYKINLVTGLDIVFPKYVLLNVEAEFINDQSVSGGLNIKF